MLVEFSKNIYPITLIACYKTSYHHTRDLSTNLTQIYTRLTLSLTMRKVLAKYLGDKIS